MAKVKIKRAGATHNLKPVGEVGETVDVHDAIADAMVSVGYAERVDGEPEKPAEKPADERETATDENADERETRDEKAAEAPKAKRGPGRPRKTDK